jgi:hypothetical protein
VGDVAGMRNKLMIVEKNCWKPTIWEMEKSFFFVGSLNDRSRVWFLSITFEICYFTPE